jgi:divalent metal cation (Fe/Co/Zn/Cd) transporter
MYLTGTLKTTPFWKAVKRSKDPSTFVVLFEDAADLLGLIVAFLGVFLGHHYNNHYFDGIASIIIGIILTAISLLLARESRSLLMGESIDETILGKVIAIAEKDPAVEKIPINPLSMYMAPEEIILLLPTVFQSSLTASQLTEGINRIKTNIQNQYPSITKIFITPIAAEEAQENDGT